jgi:hypothetical protein
MNANDFQVGAQQALSNLLLFVPKVLLFAAILVGGYFLAKFSCKMLNRLLDRIGFDRLVERGGIKRAMEKTKWDASDLLSKTLFYFVMLFILQLAFGVFGPNPISELLTRVVAYLPNIFIAGLMVVIAGAIAAGVKKIIQAALGGLSYGKFLATGASVAIWVLGVFAALDQLNIAPAIVNGLFYAMLAVIAGSAIIAIGGGGIHPMRARWEKGLARFEQEAPKLKAEAAGAQGAVEGVAKGWEHEAEHVAEHVYHAEHPETHPEPGPPEKPRFKTK